MSASHAGRSVGRGSAAATVSIACVGAVDTGPDCVNLRAHELFHADLPRVLVQMTAEFHSCDAVRTTHQQGAVTECAGLADYFRDEGEELMLKATRSLSGGWGTRWSAEHQRIQMRLPAGDLDKRQNTSLKPGAWSSVRICAKPLYLVCQRAPRVNSELGQQMLLVLEVSVGRAA